MKYIIFDMDGVLVNTEPLHFKIWKQVCQNYGFDLDYDVYKPCIGSTNNYLFSLIYEAYHINFTGNEEVLKQYRKYKEESIQKDGFPRIDGVIETIKYLRDKGYVLAVASSSPQKYIEAAMDDLGIKECFALLFSGERVVHPKPAPDIFLEVASRLNAEVKDCLVIEDSTNGSRAAKAAGMKCFGFINPDSGHQDVSSAEKTFTNFKQLIEML